MNREDIIRMARECDWVIYEDMPYADVQAIQDALIERLERFASLVAAAEREACAKVCWYAGLACEVRQGADLCFELSEAIRARSNP